MVWDRSLGSCLYFTGVTSTLWELLSFLTKASLGLPLSSLPMSVWPCVCMCVYQSSVCLRHDDVIKWKHFPRYWPFVRGIHRSPMNSLHKGQWHRALMFSLICVWINGRVNNPEAGDLRRYRAHYDVTIMWCMITHHPFNLGSPNLDQKCKSPWLRSILFWGAIDLDLQCQI